ncbi:DEAD/DEAH box helicase family protein [Selenomonas sp.]|uniref:DEAD/DEAH box helicase family protein n=1 Tax=Selenomonas sp. TaxID=2053611 RepID=UPI003FA1F2F8
MASNFDFLLAQKNYKAIAKTAMEAEQSLKTSYPKSTVLAARALKLAVRWMFTHDADLALPYHEAIARLIHEPTLKKLRPEGMDAIGHYVLHLGNIVAYRSVDVPREAAVLSLRALHCSLTWLAACYAEDFSPRPFDETLLSAEGREKVKDPLKLRALYKEPFEGGALLPRRKKNRETAERLAKLRQKNNNGEVVSVPLDLVAECRGRYLLVDGAQAGWTLDEDCFMNCAIEGAGKKAPPVDFLFTDAEKKPLAVMAVKTAQSLEEGVAQVKEWAALIEKKYAERPYLFLLHEGKYWFLDERRDALRRISGCFSRIDLERRMGFRRLYDPESHPDLSSGIVNRPYQREAVWHICEDVHKGVRRLLVSTPPGTGKTRMAAGAIEALFQQKAIGKVLYLADREELVHQAYDQFAMILPDMKSVDLLGDVREEEQADIVFATATAMMDAVNENRAEDGARLYDPAHFDLVVIDESHPSVYDDHLVLLRYFDAILLGFSSVAPSAPGEADVYRFYDLAPGKPTFAYSIEEARRDGWLVDFTLRDEAPDTLMDSHLRYAELTDEQRTIAEMEYSDTGAITSKDFDLPAVNNWLFSEEKIQAMLENLLEHGFKAKDGKLGKTIIFAKNSLQAKAIAFIFQRLHPEYGADFIRALDARTPDLAAAVHAFSAQEEQPTIAVSVDVLDTGFDMPPVVNLVFFRKVHSLSKFSQMLGRGMRFCENLGGEGKDKEKFLVIDYCRNFAFFDMEQ